MKFISPKDLKQKIDNNDPIQIIDTRERDKYDLGHLPGAESMPQLELPGMLNQINKDQTVIIYCIYGVKSELVYIYLKDKLKIKELYILEGGIYQYSIDIDSTILV